MSEDIPKATHAGEIRIGDAKIPCAVLEDGTRILTQYGFYRAIGRSGRPAAGRGSEVEKVAPFLNLKNLKPFVNKELSDSTSPIVFHPISGGMAYGYQAEILPKVCEVYLSARDAGVLIKTQLKFAKACEILMRGLAHIGITALVDEATGYQDIRLKNALAKILEKYIAKEYREWTKTFPDAFYREMFRLRRWPLDPESVKRPSIIGKYTNDIIYARLVPGVLRELQEKNPVTEKGYRKKRHHQWLTGNIGHPALREHITGVLALMRASSNWDQFYRMVQRAYPNLNEQIPLALDD